MAISLNCTECGRVYTANYGTNQLKCLLCQTKSNQTSDEQMCWEKLSLEQRIEELKAKIALKVGNKLFSL